MKNFLLLLFVFSIGHVCSQKQLLSPAEKIYLDSYPESQFISVFVQGDTDVLQEFAKSNKLILKKGAGNYFRLSLTISQLLTLSEIPEIYAIDISISKGRVLNDSARVINNVEPIF